MLKKISKNAHALKDWWQNEAHSLWKKMSCGASQIYRMRHSAHGEEWRAQGKHQKHHHKASFKK